MQKFRLRKESYENHWKFCIKRLIFFIWFQYLSISQIPENFHAFFRNLKKYDKILSVKIHNFFLCFNYLFILVNDVYIRLKIKINVIFGFLGFWS